MEKVHLLFILSILFLFPACSPTQSDMFRSYVNTYNNYLDIKLNLTKDGNIEIGGTKFENIHYYWKAKGRGKEVYDSLCILHNDVSYNTERNYFDGVTTWGHCAMNDIVSITIQSDNDFDDQHPAGTPLDDVVRFISVSLQKFIDSNYKLTYDWENETPANFGKEEKMADFKNWEESENYHPVDIRLSEMTLSNATTLMPIEFFGYLIFESTPTLLKTHRITVTVHTSDGKAHTSSITKVFE